MQSYSDDASAWTCSPTVLLLDTTPLIFWQRDWSDIETYNAAAQWVLAVGIVLSAYKRSAVPLIVALAAALILFAPRHCKNHHNSSMGSSCSSNYKCHHHPTQSNDTPQLCSGTSQHYPNNPSHCDYNAAVRGAFQRPPQLAPAPHLAAAQMRVSPEIYSLGRNLTPIADPTYLARVPISTNSPWGCRRNVEDAGRFRLSY